MILYLVDKSTTNLLLIAEIRDYYHKSPMDLAMEYIHDSDNSLTDDEAQRLIFEARKKERDILEFYMSGKDPLLQQINEQYSVKTKSGLKIYL